MPPTTEVPPGQAVGIEAARNSLYASDPVLIPDTWHIDPYGVAWSHDVPLRFVVDNLGWERLESTPQGQALVREALQGRTQWTSTETAWAHKLAAKWRADHPGEDPTYEALQWAFEHRIACAPDADLYPVIRAEIQAQEARRSGHKG
ncbi:hypothetical protein [Streptomyces lydicus]|uniref:hypothetical protein n=1 Tax=Streptomyces lydicus TaxID=47763 RepID=UPI001F5123C9|nr:hypothetical protein [Streptomyces lydicus]